MDRNQKIENLNILSEKNIITPNELREQFPHTANVIEVVSQGQETIKNILSGKDKRILVVVGPCSIHDIKSAKEYALNLSKLAEELKDSLFLVMRVYFEKPRTTVGWEGFVNDPYLDDSHDIEEGLKLARQLLIYIAELGLPAAGEALDIVTPQYIQDLFSWTAIGARTTESQSHRKMASGLSAAVGFKNGTSGNIDIAVQALQSVAAPHNFVSIAPDGKVAIVKTKGNPNSHIILRGGSTGPNYDAASVRFCEEKMKKAGFTPNIMIDCSHANSGKQAINQPKVLDAVEKQIIEGNQSITGIMVESNINFGKQAIPCDLKTLQYGVSITDECLGWEETASMLRDFAKNIQDSLNKR